MNQDKRGKLNKSSMQLTPVSVVSVGSAVRRWVRAALCLSASPAFITRPLTTHGIWSPDCKNVIDVQNRLWYYCWPITFFLPQSKMLRQISLMRLTLPPSRKMILNKTLQKNVSLRSISTRAQYAAYFKTLDLPISATKEQVRRRYIELAKQHHPDAGE